MNHAPDSLISSVSLFQTPPFADLRSISIVHRHLLLTCHNQEQADTLLTYADKIAKEVSPHADRVRIYVRGRHAYGFQTKLYRRDTQ